MHSESRNVWWTLRFSRNTTLIKVLIVFHLLYILVDVACLLAMCPTSPHFCGRNEIPNVFEDWGTSRDERTREEPKSSWKFLSVDRGAPKPNSVLVLDRLWPEKKTIDCGLVFWDAHSDVRKTRSHVDGSSDSRTELIAGEDDEVWVRVPNECQQGGCSGKRNVVGRDAECRFCGADWEEEYEIEMSLARKYGEKTN